MFPLQVALTHKVALPEPHGLTNNHIIALIAIGNNLYFGTGGGQVVSFFSV